jgi:hypothetical protein
MKSIKTDLNPHNRSNKYLRIHAVFDPSERLRLLRLWYWLEDLHCNQMIDLLINRELMTYSKTDNRSIRNVNETNSL